jgi:5-methylcytosine-specific restriction endonuclease McrA
MRKLPKPVDSVEEVFLECISNMRNEQDKSKLASCKNVIAEAARHFEAKVEANQAHTIGRTDNIAGIVTKEDMSKVYNDKMAKKSAPGRKYYDKYIAAPKNGICPLCGHRVASTLDHYLPKKKYPIFAVTPLNLVPACKDCNTGKSEFDFTKSEEETIHPYFDDIENEPWLYAKIIEDEDPVLVYEVRKPDAWTSIMYERVQNHFKLFKLNALYSAHAAEQLRNNRKLLVKMYNTTGSVGVTEFLGEYYDSSRSVHLNSWQTAMYRVLYESRWFCEEWISKQT